MDLVVAVFNSTTGDEQGVGHAVIGCRGEHPDEHGDAGGIGDPAHRVGPPAVEAFGDRRQRNPEPAHGGLRENHQPRSGVGRAAGVVLHQRQIGDRVGTRQNLRARDPHGRQPSREPLLTTAP